MEGKLDLRDRKLIYTLDFDSRMPLTALAKKLGISKQAAKYRLENLKKRGVLQGFYADINSSKIGFAIYLVYFKFHHMTAEIEKELVDHLSRQESIGVNVSINGRWDYCIGIWAESIIHFKRQYQQIMRDYERYVKNKMVTIETDFYYFKPKQIFEENGSDQITMTGDIEKFELDKTDRTILIKLAGDARTSLVELGNTAKLSPNAVKERIKSLEKNGVILGYRVMINYPLLGFLHYRVFLHLENTTEQKERVMIQFLKHTKPVVSVTKTIGYCELEFRAIVSEIHELYELLEGLRNRFPDLITDYEPILYFKFHKPLNYFPFLK